MTEWIKIKKRKKKTRPIYLLCTQYSLQIKGQIHTDNKDMENIFHTNKNEKKAGASNTHIQQNGL